MPGARHSAGHFLLSLDGTLTRVERLAGGSIRGEVVTYRTGTGSPPIKRIGVVRYEPLRLAIGMGMGQPLYAWIKAALGGAPVSKSGSLALASAQGKALAYRPFRDALVEEITFPALDAGSKEAALFAITLAPEQIAYAGGDGADLGTTVGARQKRWLRSNFRFQLAGLEAACKRVARIESFTVTQNMVEIAGGGSPGTTRRPTTLETSILRVTFPAADAAPWLGWFDDFVVQGHGGAGNEKAGAIELLDPGRKAILGTVTLTGCGISALDFEPLGAHGHAVPRYVAELYVQGLQVALNVA
jgi:hypothetical protein